MALNDAVPSSATDVFKRNAEDVDRLLNSSGPVINRLSTPLASWEQITQSHASWNNRGAWATATAYAINDIWQDGANWYVVLSAYTSGATAAADIAGPNVVVLSGNFVQGVEGLGFDEFAANKNLVYPVGSVEDLAGLVGVLDDQQISLKGWHPDSDVGGGTLYWDAAKPKSEHNGGTVFSPTVPFSATTGDYLSGAGETDGGGSGCWVRCKETISPELFGAAGDGISDDYAACQSAIDYTRDRELSLIWNPAKHRTSQSLKTQYDANRKPTSWFFNNTILTPDFAGSPAIIVEGGPYYQNMHGEVYIIPTVQNRMLGDYSNRDTASHGIVIESTRFKQYGVARISGMRGYGILAKSDLGGNSNDSKYNSYIELCNMGFVGVGTDDNIAVVKADLDITYCASHGFLGASGCKLRNWDANINCENNDRLDLGDAGLQVNAATGGKWFIYSEQYNTSNDIEFLSQSIGNSIFSCRANKDLIINGNNVIGGNGVHTGSFVQEFIPTVIGATTAGSASYSTQIGRYQQIGKLIYFNITVSWSGHTGTGNLQITQMPKFPIGSNPVTFSGFDIAGISSGYVPMGSVDATRNIQIFKNNAGVTNFVEIQPLGSIQVSGIYEIQ